MKNQEYLKETYEWKDLLAIVHKLGQHADLREHEKMCGR